MLGLASLFSVSRINDTFAYRNNCSDVTKPGEYCYNWGNKKNCPNGCYCVGNTKFAVGDDSDRNPNTACMQKKSSVKDHLENAGIFYCPEGFPYSMDKTGSFKGAQSKADCYYTSSINNSRIFYAEVSCPAGQYLPRLTQKCVSCSASVYCLNCGVASPNARGYICTGTNGTVTPKDQDQGVKKCESGKVPNADQTACVACESGKEPNSTQTACVPKTCSSGQYLSGGNCNSCPDGFRNTSTSAKSIEDCYYPHPSNNGTFVFYKTHNCPAGQFLPANSNGCMKCNAFPSETAGKICGGGNFIPSTQSKGLTNCPSGKIPNPDQTACINAPTMVEIPQTVVETPTKITCKPGEYVPKNTYRCVSCDSLEYGDHSMYVCPGGELFFSAGADVGFTEKCIAPSRPDHIAGKCVRDNITCIPGTYLPANSPLGTECSPCPNGKLCLGGTFEPMQSIDQGADGTCQGDTIINDFGNKCIACEFGKKPNSAHTSCVSAGSITVNPGYFLPKGSNTPKGCTGTSRYCPGGSFNMSQTSDQGIENCPANSRTTEDKTACAVTLTKKQMMYGINGTGGRYSENAVQCWTKTGADYKACMGFKSDGSLVSTSVPGLSINLKPIKAELKQFNLASPLVQAASKDLVTKESPRKD